jgi:hypothetical protein
MRPHHKVLMTDSYESRSGGSGDILTESDESGRVKVAASTAAAGMTFDFGLREGVHYVVGKLHALFPKGLLSGVQYEGGSGASDE